MFTRPFSSLEFVSKLVISYIDMSYQKKRINALSAKNGSFNIYSIYPNLNSEFAFLLKYCVFKNYTHQMRRKLIPKKDRHSKYQNFEITGFGRLLKDEKNLTEKPLSEQFFCTGFFESHKHYSIRRVVTFMTPSRPSMRISETIRYIEWLKLRKSFAFWCLFEKKYGILMCSSWNNGWKLNRFFW